MSAAHTPMVVAAARVLCNRMADARDEDHEDLWASFGYYYLEEAKAALDAAGAPDLLIMLQQYSLNLGHEKSARAEYGDAAVDRELSRRAAITKATGTKSC